MQDEFLIDASNYLESLIRSRQHLTDVPHLLAKLDATIEVEIDLARLGADKAMSEVIKDRAKVTPLKGV